METVLGSSGWYHREVQGRVLFTSVLIRTLDSFSIRGIRIGTPWPLSDRDNQFPLQVREELLGAWRNPQYRGSSYLAET